MCFSCSCLFVLYVLGFVLFLFLLVSGLAAVCDCGTPWTFLLTFFMLSLAFYFVFIVDLNPHLPSGPVHPYQLDESISNFRGVWCTFSFLFYFEDIPVSK